MRIEVNGRAIGYEDSGGHGVALVLVHGFPLDRRIWAAQVRGLADVARVIAPDLSGFGESALTTSAMTMDDYAGEVGALLDALGVASAVVGGVSMGGYVTMAFHRRYPGRLLGTLLVDTRSGADSVEARRARDVASALARAEGAGALAAQSIGKMLTPAAAQGSTAPEDPKRRALLDMMSSQSVGGIVGALRAMRDRPDSGASVARIAVPTLVVCGAEDALIPPRESEALRDAIPGARLVIIPGAAHLPNYEQPDAFNAAVREFLGGLG